MIHQNYRIALTWHYFVTAGFPSQRPVMWGFDDLCHNKRLSNQNTSDLWCHHAHYEVTVMSTFYFPSLQNITMFKSDYLENIFCQIHLHVGNFTCPGLSRSIWSPAYLKDVQKLFSFWVTSAQFWLDDGPIIRTLQKITYFQPLLAISLIFSPILDQVGMIMRARWFKNVNNSMKWSTVIQWYNQKKYILHFQSIDKEYNSSWFYHLMRDVSFNQIISSYL